MWAEEYRKRFFGLDTRRKLWYLIIGFINNYFSKECYIWLNKM